MMLTLNKFIPSWASLLAQTANELPSANPTPGQVLQQGTQLKLLANKIPAAEYVLPSHKLKMSANGEMILVEFYRRLHI